MSKFRDLNKQTQIAVENKETVPVLITQVNDNDNDKTMQNNAESRHVSLAAYKEFADLYDTVVKEVLGGAEQRLKTLGCEKCDRESLSKAADLEKYAIEASISRQLKFELKCL